MQASSTIWKLLEAFDEPICYSRITYAIYISGGDIVLKIKIYIGGSDELVNHKRSYDSIRLRLSESKLVSCDVEVINSPSSRFEYPALSRLWQDSQQDEFYGLYLHCKGSSKPDGVQFDNGAAWLHYMLFGLVDNNDVCIGHLDAGADLVGAMWYRHFKGNCFWFKSDYVRGLMNPLTLDQSNRFQAEYWCAQQYWWGGYKYPKVKNLFYIPMESDDDFIRYKINGFIPEINEKNKCTDIDYAIKNNHLSVYDKIEITEEDKEKYNNILSHYINYN